VERRAVIQGQLNPPTDRAEEPLFDGVQHHHQLVGDLLVGPARGQQPQHLQLAVAERLHQPRNAGDLVGRGWGGAGTVRLECPRQPVQVARRHRTGQRHLAGALGGVEPAEQAGHRRALVDEHPHIALIASQDQRLGQRGQRASLVAHRVQGEPLHRPQLDDLPVRPWVTARSWSRASSPSARSGSCSASSTRARTRYSPSRG